MKQKHLTIEDRETIESMLKNNYNFTQIANRLNKHRTTISKEVFNRRFKKEYIQYNTYFANCISTAECADSGSKVCNKHCKLFIENKCEILDKAPYVCNPCNKKNHCRKSKFYYRGKDSHLEYVDFRSESRIGVRISQEEIFNINHIITPLIKDQDQSINHVYINNPDLLYFSKPTLYSYVNSNLFSFTDMDLKRKVKYKPRKNNKKRRTRTEAIIRIDRTHQDFLDYISLNPDASIVEMDTVEGVKGGKVLLTLLFRKSNFMLIYVMDNKTMACVEKVFNSIKTIIGNELFKNLFEVILTDNGSEFFNPISIETDYKTGELLVHIFYCDPGASYQKGSLERNHQFIRYVLPKSTSFNHLKQEHCYLLASHINSTARIILNNKTPYEGVQFIMHDEIITKLGITFIEASKVSLSSKLLPKK